MTEFPTVRVAAVQATPVILDAEAFVPLYPSNAWARSAAGFSGWDELWEQLWHNSVDVQARG